MNKQIENSLIGVLRIKKELLEDMLVSTRKAAELLVSDNIEEFEREIGRCESIMLKVDELAQTEQALSASPAGTLPEELAVKKEIELILKQLADANAECRKASGEKLKECGSRIKALRQTKQGIGVYEPQTNPGAIFFDAKQ